MTRTNQGGSGLKFIVIGVILVALLAGGMYLLRQQLTQPDQTWTPEESGETITPDEEEVTIEQSPSVEEQAIPVTGVELPQTGVGEVSSVVSLGLLSLAAISYVRSRRPELSL